MNVAGQSTVVSQPLQPQFVSVAGPQQSMYQLGTPNQLGVFPPITNPLPFPHSPWAMMNQSSSSAAAMVDPLTQQHQHLMQQQQALTAQQQQLNAQHAFF